MLIDINHFDVIYILDLLEHEEKLILKVEECDELVKETTAKQSKIMGDNTSINQNNR